eukprot:g11007.t1
MVMLDIPFALPVDVCPPRDLFNSLVRKTSASGVVSTGGIAGGDVMHGGKQQAADGAAMALNSGSKKDSGAATAAAAAVAANWDVDQGERRNATGRVAAAPRSSGSDAKAVATSGGIDRHWYFTVGQELVWEANLQPHHAAMAAAMTAMTAAAVKGSAAAAAAAAAASAVAATGTHSRGREGDEGRASRRAAGHTARDRSRRHEGVTGSIHAGAPGSTATSAAVAPFAPRKADGREGFYLDGQWVDLATACKEDRAVTATNPEARQGITGIDDSSRKNPVAHAGVAARRGGGTGAGAAAPLHDGCGAQIGGAWGQGYRQGRKEGARQGLPQDGSWQQQRPASGTNIRPDEKRNFKYNQNGGGGRPHAYFSGAPFIRRQPRQHPRVGLMIKSQPFLEEIAVAVGGVKSLGSFIRVKIRGDGKCLWTSSMTGVLLWAVSQPGSTTARDVRQRLTNVIGASGRIASLDLTKEQMVSVSTHHLSLF